MRERAVAAVEERRWLEENYWRRGTLFPGEEKPVKKTGRGWRGTVGRIARGGGLLGYGIIVHTQVIEYKYPIYIYIYIK
jgi:hypothetical protein